MTAQFDPNAFLDATTTDASVRLPPLPVGDYRATIDELKGNTWTAKDGSKSGSKFDVTLKVDPLSGPANGAKDKEGRPIDWPESVTVSDSIMLEVTDSGAIDYGVGKNGRLRMYRDATGLNVAGQPFSPRQLVGRQILVNITHREYQNETFNNAGKLAKL